MRIGLPASVLALLIPLAVSCQRPAPLSAPADSAVAVNEPLARLVERMHVHTDSLWFHVDKSDRSFEVRNGAQVLKRYPCVLGEHPVGDKMRQGDRRTPGGTFTFRSKRRPHQWHVFIWIDYPNAESWRRFKERKRQGVIPNDADIGGEVGIHGVPEGKDDWITQGADWTWGCIALRNADVDEIYPYITPQRTRLVIEP